MEAVTLSQETITAVSQQFVQALKNEGLVLVPEKVAQYSTAFYNARNKAFKKTHVTAQTIIKYNMLEGVKSVKTIKNMVADGRLTKREWFRDERGALQIIVEGIKRINKS